MDTEISADEIEIKEDPIESYIQRKLNYGNEKVSTRRREIVLREYEMFLYKEFDGLHVCEASDEHVIAFNDFLSKEYRNDEGEVRERYYTREKKNPQDDRLKKIDVGDTTRHTQLEYITEFYNWLEGNNVISSNPGRKALSDLPSSEFDTSSPDRPRIDIDSMAEFLEWLPSGFPTVFWLFLLKTGARVGEASNVDLSCLNLDHPVYRSYIKKKGIDLKPILDDKPDSVYFRPKFRKGDEIEGEVRRFGNKCMCEGGHINPIDEELKKALVEWILIRPEAYQHPSQSKPLFSVDYGGAKNNRVSRKIIDSIFLDRDDRPESGYLKEYGWYEKAASNSEKVTFHYTRHYFTHNHKKGRGVYDDYIPSDVISYLRGDVADDDIKDTVYSHSDWDDWSRFVRDPYLEGVYQFGLYD